MDIDEDEGTRTMTENTTPTVRYARVIARRGEDEVAPYLPGNYRVIGESPSAEFEGRSEVLVAGVDNAGWTMDEYVLPRLGSGLIAGREITAEQAREALPAEDADAVWEHAYHIAWIGASNPKGVERTWLIDATRHGQDHPGVRAILAHLDFLHGQGIGPEFADFDAVRDNARRLGIEDAEGNYVASWERKPRTEHVHARECATIGCHAKPTEYISYTYRGEGPEETDQVCTPCADSYSRRPVLTGFRRSAISGCCENCEGTE
jgi:hypothetical protein